MSEYEPEINQVEVPVLNRDLCNSWLEHRDLNVTDGMICAGYKEGGKDACQVSTFHYINFLKYNVLQAPTTLMDVVIKYLSEIFFRCFLLLSHT